MKIKIAITCANAAFDDIEELSRILVVLADRAEGLEVSQFPELDGLTLRDYNGNKVGKVTVEK